ncbi:hypothetical protein GCM10025780_27700 [Frondihabitans cladoniiphilus]|uniref:Uncharacterized protein n=1 Tax=Frondihabitans cladoniiphilus TaxID=715785 RepID=A0ABP8W7I2_9MICO
MGAAAEAMMSVLSAEALVLPDDDEHAARVTASPRAAAARRLRRTVRTDGAFLIAAGRAIFGMGVLL